MKKNEVKPNDEPDVIVSSVKQTPSQKLSDIIVQRLIKENIISSDTAKKIGIKFAEGNIKQEDWRMLIETQRKQGD